MSYVEVGAQIDLRHLNKKVSAPARLRRTPTQMLVAVGTQIVFTRRGPARRIPVVFA